MHAHSVSILSAIRHERGWDSRLFRGKLRSRSRIDPFNLANCAKPNFNRGKRANIARPETACLLDNSHRYFYLAATSGSQWDGIVALQSSVERAIASSAAIWADCAEKASNHRADYLRDALAVGSVANAIEKDARSCASAVYLGPSELLCRRDYTRIYRVLYGAAEWIDKWIPYRNSWSLGLPRIMLLARLNNGDPRYNRK